jgi:hypothetical protein
MQSGGSLRIGTELVDVAKDRQLWGAQYDRKPGISLWSKMKFPTRLGIQGWATLPATDMSFVYSVMMRSAHSTSETKIVGLPNFAPHWRKSVSSTLRARQQAPQAKI